MFCTKVGLAALLGMLGATACSPAFAAANLVTNGGFESETVAGVASDQSYQLVSDRDPNGAVSTGWVNTAYSFLFAPDVKAASGTTADTTGATSPENGNAKLVLWGPGNGQNNGLTNSPTGGKFLASDGAYEQGSISQKIDNLTIGTAYILSFYWAAAQQQNYTGDTTEGWSVTFGGQTFNTPTVSTASMGFSPWRSQTFTFQASTTSQVLSFMAIGAPSGTPPFSLLDGVSLQVPEPASWAIVALGVVGAGVLTRRRRRASVAGATAA